MANIEVKSPRVLSDLTENTDTSDNDILIVGNDGGNNIHRITFGNIVTALKNKFLNWVFDDLSTTSKTVVGAVNELNSGISQLNSDLNSVNTSLDGKAPTSHASSATTYGVGTTSNYGHCMTINNLTTSSHTNGYALSAYQGYVLNNNISGVSGLEIQRGSIKFSSVNASGVTEATVTFSKEFSGSPYVVCTLSNVTSVNYGSISISTTSRSATGFTIRLHNNTTSSSLSPYVHWIAVY